MQRLDEQLIQKINDLVGEGVRNVGEMKRHLKIFVKDDLFRGKKQPERNNRRYFPKLKTIKNHMYNATIKSRLSMIDQDNVQQLADKWREQHPNDKFYYRQYKEGSVESVPNGIDSDVEEGGEDNEDIITKGKTSLHSPSRMAIQTDITLWTGSCIFGRHVQDNKVFTAFILCCGKNKCGLYYCGCVCCARRNNREYF